MQEFIVKSYLLEPKSKPNQTNCVFACGVGVAGVRFQHTAQASLELPVLAPHIPLLG